MRTTPLLARLAAATLAASALAVAPQTTAPAAADNRCGTIFAGKIYNNTPYNMTVTGDLTSGISAVIVLRPYQRASDRNMCDADFFVMPVDGLYKTTYQPKGTRQKIGAGSVVCRKEPPASRDYIIC